jgi:hypothetical protein
VNTFRQPFYRTMVIMVMISSWLFMLATSTCVMPILMQSQIQAAPLPTEMSADCDNVSHHAGAEQAQKAIQKSDCQFKPCPDSKQYPAINSKITKLDIPVLVVLFIGLSSLLFSPSITRIFPRWQRSGFANTVPIRYRYCVYLN